MKTMNIKGKEYVTVNERLKYFRENFSGYGLSTTMLSDTDGKCTMVASVVNDKGIVVANGHAFEDRQAKGSFVNQTSYIENCETSAWGRALGNFGIGIDSSVASADEVEHAIEQKASRNKFNDDVLKEVKRIQKLIIDLKKELHSALSMLKDQEFVTKVIDEAKDNTSNLDVSFWEGMISDVGLKSQKELDSE